MVLKEFIDINTHKFEEETIKSTDVVFWGWHVKEDFFTMSEGAKKLLGYENEDIGGAFSDWERIWHPDEKQRIIRTVYANISSKNQAFTIIQRLKHKNGDFHWYYSKGAIFKNDKNETEKVYGFSVNADELIQVYQHFSLDEEMYLDYIKATNTATWYWNIETGETTYNEKWADMIGYTLKELAPISFKTWMKHINPNDLEKANQIIDHTLSGEKDFYENTFRMTHKNGSDVWIHDRGRIIRWTKDGKPLIMVGTHNDITQAKKLELQLIEDEERYKNLVDSSYDIIYSFNLKGEFQFISSAWERLLGHPIKDVMYKSFRPYVHLDDLGKIDNFFTGILKEDKRLEVSEYRLLHKNGTWRFFTTNATSLKDENGVVVGFAGTAREITEQKKLQEQLSKEKDLFKKTLLSVGDAIISTDHHGKVVMMNPVAQILLHVKEKDSINKELQDIFRLEDGVDQLLKENIATTMILNKTSIKLEEGILINNENKKKPIEYSATLIQDLAGVEDGVVIVFRDISERIERQKEIEYLSYHDHLTSFYNRRYYENYIKKLDKTDCPVSMMLLDINDLKRFNDTFGHDAGDELIKKVSEVIREIAVDACVCRIGGDEFVILYDRDVDLKHIENLINNELKKHKLYDSEIGVSIGFNKRLDKYDHLVDIQKRADLYLYDCKKQYHNGDTKKRY